MSEKAYMTSQNMQKTVDQQENEAVGRELCISCCLECLSFKNYGFSSSALIQARHP